MYNYNPLSLYSFWGPRPGAFLFIPAPWTQYSGSPTKKRLFPPLLDPAPYLKLYNSAKT